jgi:hypothetical protein
MEVEEAKTGLCFKANKLTTLVLSEILDQDCATSSNFDFDSRLVLLITTLSRELNRVFRVVVVEPRSS